MMVLTREYVKDILDYDLLTGVFTWIKPNANRIKAGDIAGSTNSKGYRVIKVLGKAYKAHRLAFLWMLGYMPDQVDHINHKKSDNKWFNLRPANNQINQRNYSLQKNNKSGAHDVTWSEQHKQWRVRIASGGKRIHVGLFKDKEKAIAARKEAEKHYGYHVNHGH